jgi:hypothetical protein
VARLQEMADALNGAPEVRCPLPSVPMSVHTLSRAPTAAGAACSHSSRSRP